MEYLIKWVDVEVILEKFVENVLRVLLRFVVNYGILNVLIID